MVAGAQPLVVIVHRYREHDLGALLADHILIQPIAHAAWGWQAVRAGRSQVMSRGYRLSLGLFGDNRATERHALVANTNRARPGDQALNLFLTPATE